MRNCSASLQCHTAHPLPSNLHRAALHLRCRLADRLPGFVLALGQSVEWGEEEACFKGLAQVRCAVVVRVGRGEGGGGAAPLHPLPAWILSVAVNSLLPLTRPAPPHTHTLCQTLLACRRWRSYIGCSQA